MIHARQSACAPQPAQARVRAWTRAAALVGILVLGACGDDGPIDVDSLRFGQIGQIEVTVEAPLRLGEGSLRQTLVWGSSGAWSLLESISYRDQEGDRSFRRSTGDPSQLAGAYASLITQLNEQEGLKLFIGDALSPDSLWACAETRTELTFTIRDEARGEEVAWTRCADGSLGNLNPAGAGPDPAASRLVVATLLAREATLGEAWTSAYLGSVPFGTLDRGEDSGSSIIAPVTFIDAGGFQKFWAEHAPGRPAPAVDFSKDMVVAALVGPRTEAGDSVEVRRILQVDQGTITEVFERIPGDFCSPAARTHVPYHIVVAPRTPIPHRFSDIRVERVACGG